MGITIANRWLSAAIKFLPYPNSLPTSPYSNSSSVYRGGGPLAVEEFTKEGEPVGPLAVEEFTKEGEPVGPLAVEEFTRESLFPPLTGEVPKAEGY